MSTPPGEPEQPPSPYEPPPSDPSPWAQPTAPPPSGHPTEPPQSGPPAEPPPWEQPPPGEQPWGQPTPAEPPWGQPPPGGQPWGQQQWGQPTYPPPGQYGPPAGGGTNVLAILSLVLAFVFAPAGVVLGHLAKRQIRRTGEAGDQLATWGLVLSYAFTVIGVLVCCGWLALVVWAGASGSSGTDY
ncbi:DUF4190 domain-containing protein [Micromonospora matsumotoense]|uniref:DUF4190 domain-containing protein n=1 Tax=Micromonospora matsumotoense TaxID=121616 RepID=UPI003447D1A9